MADPPVLASRRARRFGAGLAAGLVLGYSVRRGTQRLRPTLDRVAHRGGAADAPENTLPAFTQARDAGIPTWELDVQLTTDDALVVFHDETLDRTSTGHGPLAGHTLAELEQLDAGAWFDSRWQGTRIPTLEQVIALAHTAPHGGARLLVEIKSPHLYPGIERRLLSVLDTAGYTDRVIVMSFDGSSLARVRELAPVVPLCHLTGPSVLLPLHPAADAEVVGPYWQVPAFDPLVIALSHRAGRMVYPWTVDDLAAARWLRFWGIDSITSNRLDVLQALA